MQIRITFLTSELALANPTTFAESCEELCHFNPILTPFVEFNVKTKKVATSFISDLRNLNSNLLIYTYLLFLQKDSLGIKYWAHKLLFFFKGMNLCSLLFGNLEKKKLTLELL